MKLKKSKGSRIIAFINKLTLGFCSKIPASLTGSFLSGKLGNGRSGLISSLFERISFSKRVSTPAKRVIARGFDRSTILGAVSGVMKLVPFVQLRTVGLIALGFGIFTAVASLIKQSIGGEITTDPALMLGILSACTGATLIISAKSCYQAIRESRIASFILFKLFGLKTSDAYLNKKSIVLNYWGVGIGLAAGLLGIITDPFTVLVIPAVFLVSYALLCSPESGVVLMLLLVPLLHGKRLALLSLFVGLSYLIKLIRGKRTLKLDFTSITVLLFALSVFFGGVASVTPRTSFGEASVRLSLIVAYFVTVNTVKTAVWTKRCFSALLFSFGATLISGLAGRIISSINTPGADSLAALLPSEVLTLYSFNSLLTVMCVAFFPFLLTGAFLNRTEGSRFVYFCAIAVSVYCIVSGSSFGALLSVIFGTVLLSVIINRRNAGIIVTLAAAFPILLLALPSSVTVPIARTVGLSGALSSFEAETISETISIIRSTLWGGIGLGVEALKRVYPLFSTNSVPLQNYNSLYTALTVSLGISGLLIFAVFTVSLARRFFSYLSRCKDDGTYLKYSATAAFTSVFSLTVLGFTDNIFADPTVFCLFFLITALALSTVSVADSERKHAEIDGPYISLTVSNDKDTVTKGDNDNERSE